METTGENLGRRLLRGLETLRPRDVGLSAQSTADGVQTFAYCVLEREQIRAMRVSDPTLVVVLRGCKEIYQGAAVARYRAGEPFLLPGGATVDIVNIPDEKSGLFESVCLRIDAGLRRALRYRAAPPGQHRAPVSPLGCRITLTADLVDAFCRAAKVLGAPKGGPLLAQHRVLEILILLEASGIEGLGATSVTERMERIVLADPAHDWALEETARLLAMSTATLRRRLSLEGTSFRAVLLQVRMALAAQMLSEGRSTVNDAAQASGYASRSHFARRYRAAYGMLPKAARSRDVTPTIAH